MFNLIDEILHHEILDKILNHGGNAVQVSNLEKIPKRKLQTKLVNKLT